MRRADDDAGDAELELLQDAADQPFAAHLCEARRRGLDRDALFDYCDALPGRPGLRSEGQASVEGAECTNERETHGNVALERGICVS